MCKTHDTKFDFFVFVLERVARRLESLACNCCFSCCVRCLCCCEKDKRRWWRMRTKKNRLDSVGAGVNVFLVSGLESLLHVDGRRSTITSLASRRLCSSEPKRRRCRARARARRWPFFVCFCFLFCPSLGAARSCGGALLMACAPCSAPCARLGVVCAARRCVCSALCVQLALYSVFFLRH